MSSANLKYASPEVLAICTRGTGGYTLHARPRHCHCRRSRQTWRSCWILLATFLTTEGAAAIWLQTPACKRVTSQQDCTPHGTEPRAALTSRLTCMRIFFTAGSGLSRISVVWR